MALQEALRRDSSSKQSLIKQRSLKWEMKTVCLPPFLPMDLQRSARLEGVTLGQEKMGILLSIDKHVKTQKKDKRVKEKAETVSHHISPTVSL